MSRITINTDKLSEIKKQECKAIVQKLLEESDFTDLYSNRSKIENIDEWDNYRVSLQRLKFNPISDYELPTKPKLIWKDF